MASQPPVPVNDEGAVLTGKPTVILVPAGKNACVDWQLRAPSGAPLNLTGCLVVDDDPEAPTHRVVVRFRMKEAMSTCEGAPPECAPEATVISAENGTVRVCFTTELQTPGIYMASFGVFDEYDDPESEDPDDPEIVSRLLYENEFYLVAEATTWSGNSGLPRWATLREQLADFPGENLLSLQQRFTDADIASAAVFCVEYWNEALPQTPQQRFDTRTFPYRAAWVDGIKGRLFMLHAERLRSNHLPLQGGGLTVNDKDKYDQYDQRGLFLWTNFQKFVQGQKLRWNMLRGASAKTIWGY